LSPASTTPTGSLAERDVARTRNLAAAMTNHFRIDFDGPESGGFGDVTAPTLVVHGALDPVYPLPHGCVPRSRARSCSCSTTPATAYRRPRGTCSPPH
jgi:hypothetical protein